MSTDTITPVELSVLDVPYEVPTPGPPNIVHNLHREWYWDEHDYDSYSCPDCGRGADETRFDVHHVDFNFRNGLPANLLGLCYPCHYIRHKNAYTRERLGEWKATIDEIGN